eukprot:scaffold208788_cov31-Attheya_sp.AAC.1
MYLAGVPVFTIMLIGWWSSDAFLRYIRHQVQEFSAGVSSKMLLAPDYFTIPYTHHEDPRTSGNTNNFAACLNKMASTPSVVPSNQHLTSISDSSDALLATDHFVSMAYFGLWPLLSLEYPGPLGEFWLHT